MSNIEENIEKMRRALNNSKKFKCVYGRGKIPDSFFNSLKSPGGKILSRIEGLPTSYCYIDIYEKHTQIDSHMVEKVFLNFKENPDNANKLVERYLGNFLKQYNIKY